MKRKLNNFFSLFVVMLLMVGLFGCDKNDSSDQNELKELLASEINDAVDKINWERINEINSYYDLDEPLTDLDIQSKTILEGVDFNDNGFWIIFKRTNVFPELKISDFGFYNAERIEYFFDICPPQDADPNYIDNYHQMAFITLKEKGKDKVLEAVEFFRQFRFLKNVGPDYKYQIVSPVYPYGDPEVIENMRRIFEQIKSIKNS